MKIGLIHIAERPDSWGDYYKWLIRRETNHELVLCWEDVGYKEYQWTGKGCDIYIRIGDSLMYQTPDWMHPLIYYVSDTHVNDGVDCNAIALEADYTFACQKEAVNKGVADEWLPHAAYYFPDPKPNPAYLLSSAVVLAENSTLFGKRTQMSNILKQRYGNDVKIGRGPMHQEMASMYADSLFVWNHSVNNDVNMRIFEGGAAGSVVLTNRIHDNGLDEIFDKGVIQYESINHLISLVEYYRKDRGRYLTLGCELQQIIKERHTYRHRLEVLLDRAERLQPKRKNGGRPRKKDDNSPGNDVSGHTPSDTDDSKGLQSVHG